MIFRIALICGSLFALFGPGIREHLDLTADPWRFNDDVRQQVVPFLQDATDSPVAGYADRYYLACMPRGYASLYRGVGHPVALSNLLPWLLFGVVLAGLALIAGAMGGAVLAWCSLALCLSGSIWFDRLTGGVPRSFAYPLVVLVALGLFRGKPSWLVVATALGAAFYYPVAVLAGLSLFLDRMVLPKRWTGRRQSRRRAALLVAGTALLTLVLALPGIVASRSFGGMLDPGQAASWPEAGPGGRYAGADLVGGWDFARNLTRTTFQTFVGTADLPFNEALRARTGQHEKTWGWILLLATVVVSVPLARADDRARRLLALPFAGLLGYFLASVLAPRLFLPERYLAYALPPFLCLALPAGVAAVMRRAGGGSRAAGAVALLVTVALLIGFGSRGPGSQGFLPGIDPEDRSVVERVAALPADVFVAGWPTGPVENIPYLARRHVLLNYETHQVLHRGYATEMRRRMRALIAACYAGDPAPVRRLRDEFGVTHLLVDRRQFEGTSPPWYFAPFADETREAMQELETPAWVLDHAAQLAVAETDHYVLLELDRVQ